MSKFVIKTEDPVKDYLVKILESNSVEISILSFFINKYNYYINNIKLNDLSTIWKLSFHSSERKKCRNILDISVATFNTSLHNLKKKGLVIIDSEGNPSITKMLLFNPEVNNTLTFIFEKDVKTEENTANN
jgi:hypothetical protein